MAHLLHFSEDPNIRVFHPHVPSSSPDNPPMVWAVDEEHAPGFWFPRDAPRACCWGEPKSEIARTLRRVARDLGGVAEQPRKSFWPLSRSRPALAVVRG